MRNECVVLGLVNIQKDHVFRPVGMWVKEEVTITYVPINKTLRLVMQYYNTLFYQQYRY